MFVYSGDAAGSGEFFKAAANRMTDMLSTYTAGGHRVTGSIYGCGPTGASARYATPSKARNSITLHAGATGNSRC